MRFHRLQSLLRRITVSNLTKWVPVQLPNGAEIRIESSADITIKESDVAGFSTISSEAWQEVTNTVEGIAQWALETLQKVQPTKASVEFGLEIGAEPGKLTALLVKGSGKANLKVTLEWSHSHNVTA
jgi:hypothetical protein